MDKQIEDINNGELAFQITRNPVYTQAMQMIQARAFNDFTNSKADDVDIRQQSWLLMQSHKEFANALEHIMEKGLFADESKRLAEADNNFVDKDLYT